MSSNQPSLFGNPAQEAVSQLLATLAPGYSNPVEHLYNLSSSTPARARIIGKVLALAPTATRPQAIAALRAAGCLP